MLDFIDHKSQKPGKFVIWWRTRGATILRGWQRGVGFSSALVILYAALLLGSLLLFVALADLMLGTRRIDWYARHKDYRVVIGHALGLAP